MPGVSTQAEESDESLLRSKPTSSPTITTANTAITRKPVAQKAPTPGRQVAWQAKQPQAQQGQQTCPHCGAGAGTDPNNVGLGINNPSNDWTQKRINDLEAEVKRLTEKASAAADKLADYEDELQRLKAARASSTTPSDHSHHGSQDHESLKAQQQTSTPEIQESHPAEDQPQAQAMAPSRSVSLSTQAHNQAVRQPMSLGRSLTTTRITNFLSARRASPAQPSTPEPQSSTSEPAGTGNFASPAPPDLQAQLTQEQNLRRSAEKKLDQTSLELEELSATLFQQANEMVATEKRERVEGETRALEREKASAQRNKTLEEKVKKLEGKLNMLEQRDAERGRRLERLEGAMKRAGRVRTLLHTPTAPVTNDAAAVTVHAATPEP